MTYRTGRRTYSFPAQQPATDPVDVVQRMNAPVYDPGVVMAEAMGVDLAAPRNHEVTVNVVVSDHVRGDVLRVLTDAQRDEMLRTLSEPATMLGDSRRHNAHANHRLEDILASIEPPGISVHEDAPNTPRLPSGGMKRKLQL